MNQFEKDLQYVKKIYNSVKNENQLRVAQNLKHNFINKYSVLVSPTDITFINLINELTQLDMTVTKKISSDYLFD